MALNATICKAVLQVSDMDRRYYAEHALTIARHPSETDEPDLWQKDLTGAIAHWIDVGQPDEKRMLRACGRANRVTVCAYRSGAELWWTPIADRLTRATNLAVWRIPASASQILGKLAARNMQLQCTVQDGRVWFSDGAETAQIEPVALKTADALEGPPPRQKRENP